VDGAGFDPTVWDGLPPKDARHLAGLIVTDLQRNHALLRDAMAAGDQTQAVRGAHSLSSVAANAGCESVRVAAATVERLLRAGDVEQAAPLAVELGQQAATLIAAIENWIAAAPDAAVAAASAVGGRR
jgi:HPt (histidine-containing phosphotransfer) domain-containing protein